MLIVLEGLDGAGKSTQVKKLRNYLETNFGSLEYIHFPRYDAPVYGDLISRFLRGDFGSNEINQRAADFESAAFLLSLKMDIFCAMLNPYRKKEEMR